MSWKVEPLPELDGYVVEHAQEGNYILSKRNRLYSSPDLRKPFTAICVIDAPFWKQALSRFRLAQRLLRFMVTNVIPLTNGDLFVTFDKTVGIIRNGAFIPLAGIVRPCRVLRSACAVDKHGEVYFGEYLANNDRDSMRVYRYRTGSEAAVIAYTFPPKAIKHIHGLYFDEYSGSIFCLTGDRAGECMILRSSDRFETVETVGEGDETWRAVSVLFDREAFYYGTDAEFRSNSIYRVDRRTRKRSELAEVDGTIFYSKQIGPDMFFATTAENAPSQKENVAAIWHVGDGCKCSEMVTFLKDRWHGTLFMFGTIHFPTSNVIPDKLYFSLVGLKEDDRTFIIRKVEV